MRYPYTAFICIAASLVLCSRAVAADPSVVIPIQLAQQPSAQGNAQATKPAPGFIPLQPAQTQIQLSNELKTLQGVERIEQRLAAIEAILKGLVGKVDLLAESTRAAHEQQRVLSERIQAQTETHHEFPSEQRWGLVYGGHAVLDRETGLVWRRGVVSRPNGLAWADALEACRNNRTGGRGGWRLPSAEEFLSLYPIDSVAPFGNVVRKDDPGNPFVYWTNSFVEFSSNQSAYSVSITMNGALNLQRGGLSNSAGYFCVRSNGAREP